MCENPLETWDQLFWKPAIWGSSLASCALEQSGAVVDPVWQEARGAGQVAGLYPDVQSKVHP